jgi:hypothetical protein
MKAKEIIFEDFRARECHEQVGELSKMNLENSRQNRLEDKKVWT